MGICYCGNPINSLNRGSERTASGDCGCCDLLNGDEGAMRDRTAASFDVVDRKAQGACRVRDLGHRIAALRASYGPSEGYRPPQDDNVKL
jgi:hypothetical protein